MASRTRSNRQAVEHGQFTRRPATPQYQAYLTEQRSILIDHIEDQAVSKGGWTERQYRAYSRLVFIERGQQMLSWNEYIEAKEQSHAGEGTGEDAKPENENEEDINRSSEAVSEMKVNSVQEGRGREYVEDIRTSPCGSQSADKDLENLLRLIASAPEAEGLQRNRGDG